MPLGWPCPLTALEKLLRRRAGDIPYQGGFVDHYLGEASILAQAAVGLMMVSGYLVVSHAKRTSSGADRDVAYVKS